jgi:hypothetical protein
MIPLAFDFFPSAFEIFLAREDYDRRLTHDDPANNSNQTSRRPVVIAWVSSLRGRNEQTWCLGARFWAFFFSPQSAVRFFG